MLYMVETGGEEGFGEGKAERKEVIEDEIDQILSKKDGMIPRERDPQLYVCCSACLWIASCLNFINNRCRHGPQGKCLNCSPLEVGLRRNFERALPHDAVVSFKCSPGIRDTWSLGILPSNTSLSIATAVN